MNDSISTKIIILIVILALFIMAYKSDKHV